MPVTFKLTDGAVLKTRNHYVGSGTLPEIIVFAIHQKCHHHQVENSTAVRAIKDFLNHFILLLFTAFLEL